ncbi:MAG: hypothetical protein ACO1N9_07870 [Flavobacterium sp.]
MKKSFTAIIALAAIPFVMNAQTNMQGSVNQSPIQGGQIFLKHKETEKATGSKYITEKYMQAKAGDRPELILVRYNAYNDSFEQQNPGATDEFATLPKIAGEKVILKGYNKEYVYMAYTNKKGENVSGYLNVITAGPKATIYRREIVTYIPEKTAQNSYQTYVAPAFKRQDDEFYISIDNAAPVLLPDNKKEFAKLFPGKEKEVLDYVKQNKIDLEKEQSLLTLGNYLKTI